jgi:hypothetical protein
MSEGSSSDTKLKKINKELIIFNLLLFTSSFLRMYEEKHQQTCYIENKIEEREDNERLLLVRFFLSFLLYFYYYIATNLK